MTNTYSIILSTVLAMFFIVAIANFLGLVSTKATKIIAIPTGVVFLILLVNAFFKIVVQI